MKLFEQEKPELVYDGNNLKKEIERLQDISCKNDVDKNKILNDIKLLEIGLKGENKIIYELLNSFIPMRIFHDVYIEYEDYKAQIDFIVITNYKIFIIECKNLIGNITINNEGTFIRDYYKTKEAIYSPMRQNIRHIDILCELIISRQKGINKLLIQNSIRKNIIPIVTFANEKTIINKKYAPNNLKKYILKIDEIVPFIKKIHKESEKLPKRYTNSLEEFIKYHAKNKDASFKEEDDNYDNKIEIDFKIIKDKLIEYRKNKALEINQPAYIIFTNEQLNDILNMLPKTTQELANIKGFGKYKIDTYGNEIIAIINDL